ncbi:MAG: GGDEF domain-containing protein [Curvibacter sp.]|nr:GGDEF domain-containing protein [Curvibacter sp.]
MSGVNLPTVIAYAGVMSALMGVILMFLRWSYPANIRGFGDWAAATFVVLLAMGIRVWVTEFTPEPVSVGAQNVCLILTALLFLAGTSQFFERPLPRWFVSAVAVGSLLAMVAFACYDQGPMHRRLFARGALLLIYGYHAWIVFRQRNSLAQGLTLATILSLIVLIGVRTVSGYLLPAEDGIRSEALMQVIYAIGYSSTDVLIPVCAILLAAEKLHFALADQAMRDSLTGALTRRALMDFGKSQLAGYQRRGAPVSVLMLDLDHFKEINDSQGHQVGDLVLQDLASRVTGLIRKPALLARYGGDEFVVLLPDTDEAQARVVADRIKLTQPGQGLPAYQVSIGLACSADLPAGSIEDLISKADHGLYAAKLKGRSPQAVAPAPAGEAGVPVFPLPDPDTA